MEVVLLSDKEFGLKNKTFSHVSHRKVRESLLQCYDYLVSASTVPGSSVVRTDEKSDKVHASEDVDPKRLIEILQFNF